MTDCPILTEEGKNKLEEELKFLKENKRQEIRKRIELAKEHGDLSENAEYHEAREEQSFIEGRILEIEKIFRTAVLADFSAKAGIRVGSKVVLESDNQRWEYSIVGSHEADPRAGLISCDSPLAQALMGRFVNQRVEVETPRGKMVYKIIEIK